MRTDQFNGGDHVCYTDPASRRVEYGVVTSRNSRWVFVRYEGSLADHGQATHPDNLTIIKPRSATQP